MEITGSRVGSVSYPDPVEGNEPPPIVAKCDFASLPKDPDNPQPSLDQLPTEWGQWIVHESTTYQLTLGFGFKESEVSKFSLLVIADKWPGIFTDHSGEIHEFHSADELYYYVGLRAKEMAQANHTSALAKRSERQSRAIEARTREKQAKAERNAALNEEKIRTKWGGKSLVGLTQVVHEALRGE